MRPEIGIRKRAAANIGVPEGEIGPPPRRGFPVACRFRITSLRLMRRHGPAAASGCSDTRAGLRQVRLQSVRPPDSPHGGLAHPELSCHEARAPVRRHIGGGLRLCGPAHDLGLDSLRVQPLRPAGPRPIAGESIDATFLVPIEPQAHRRMGDRKNLADLSVRVSIRRT